MENSYNPNQKEIF